MSAQTTTPEEARVPFASARGYAAEVECMLASDEMIRKIDVWDADPSVLTLAVRRVGEIILPRTCWPRRHGSPDATNVVLLVEAPESNRRAGVWEAELVGFRAGGPASTVGERCRPTARGELG